MSGLQLMDGNSSSSQQVSQQLTTKGGPKRLTATDKAYELSTTNYCKIEILEVPSNKKTAHLSTV